MRLTLRIDPSLKGEDRRGNISHSINGDSMVMAVMVKKPPCLPCVSTPPPLHTFPSNVGTGGGAGGQARRRKEA